VLSQPAEALSDLAPGVVVLFLAVRVRQVGEVCPQWWRAFDSCPTTCPSEPARRPGAEGGDQAGPEMSARNCIARYGQFVAVFH
jgi:hypothetical protein